MFRHIKKNPILCFIVLVLVFVLGCSQPQNQNVPPDESVTEPVAQEADKPDAQQQTAQPQQQEPRVEEADKKPNASQENPQALQRMEFAVRYMDSAEKGILSYSQAVALCRQIIKDYPGTPHETQARELLRQVPEDQRSQYHITNEELGL